MACQVVQGDESVVILVELPPPTIEYVKMLVREQLVALQIGNSVMVQPGRHEREKHLTALMSSSSSKVRRASTKPVCRNWAKVILAVRKSPIL